MNCCKAPTRKIAASAPKAWFGHWSNAGAIGLISTHDLALTEIGGLPEGHLHNVRFQDEFENGTMQFDYRLREGVVTKSNGLELMRSIGLDV